MHNIKLMMLKHTLEMFCLNCIDIVIMTLCQNNTKEIKQTSTDHKSVHAWFFLEIAFSSKSMCVCMCVCPSPRLLITSHIK